MKIPQKVRTKTNEYTALYDIDNIIGAITTIDEEETGDYYLFIHEFGSIRLLLEDFDVIEVSCPEYLKQ